MKIGILSMQRVANFGSVLQSYSLKKIVKSLCECECYFVDIIRQPEDESIELSLNDYSVENGKKSVMSKIDRYIINRVINHIKYKKQIKLIRKFQEKTLQLNVVPSKGSIYDVCIIGSDEVFNCLQSSSWGYTSQLFGNVKNALKVFTYAASCGSTSVSQISNSLKKKISESMKNLAEISVRDANTYDFVYSITNRKPIINLDPVVVGDFEAEIIANSYRKPEKYCILYSYYNRFHNREEIESILRFCKNKNLKIFSVFAPQYWIKDYVVLNPFQLLSFFKNAEFVITDTFHGAIFAAKYARKYGIVIRESNKNKLKDLIQRLDISDHTLDSISELDKVFSITDDKNKMRIKESEEYSRTKHYLEHALFDDLKNYR